MKYRRVRATLAYYCGKRVSRTPRLPALRLYLGEARRGRLPRTLGVGSLLSR